MSNAPKLKGSSFTLSVLQLADNNIAANVEYLQHKVRQAPGFLNHAPLVLNIEQVVDEIDFNALKTGVMGAGMRPVAVTGCKSPLHKEKAFKAGLAALNLPPTQSGAVSAERTQSNGNPTRVIRTPVRSGQQIYAEGADLVILNHVSNGAEIIADGSIHVHGTLRGRAIAGANGQKNSIILCQNLQAELLSIAGDYWLSDQVNREFWKQKTMISITPQGLHAELLSE